MKKVAIIGAGALGSVLAENLKEKLKDRYVITGVLTRTPARELAQKIECKTYADLEELLADQPDYAVEIAGVAAVAQYGVKILNQGIHLIVVSAGALANEELTGSLQQAALNSGSILYVASGAVGGFDLMRTFAMMGPMESRIENFKAPENLEGAPYLAGRMLSRKEPEIIFEGTVKEAIAGFPQNVNVAVATDLAVTSATEVTIHSIPRLTENRHVIKLKSDTAEAEVSIRSVPDPENPKSSTITAWSVIALLDNLASPMRFF